MDSVVKPPEEEEEVHLLLVERRVQVYLVKQSKRLMYKGRSWRRMSTCVISESTLRPILFSTSLSTQTLTPFSLSNNRTQQWLESSITSRPASAGPLYDPETATISFDQSLKDGYALAHLARSLGSEKCQGGIYNVSLFFFPSERVEVRRGRES